MLHKAAITLNIVVVSTSVLMFAYTFFAKQHVADRAKDFVAQKTLAYSRSAVKLAEHGLASPLASKLISAEKKQALQNEIAQYHLNPEAYIASLTSTSQPNIVPAAKETSKLEQFKQKIRSYHQSILQELITDLRIFTASNIFAGLFALILLFVKKIGNLRQVEIFSFIIFISVVISSWLYLDGLSFFRTIFKWHVDGHILSALPLLPFVSISSIKRQNPGHSSQTPTFRALLAPHQINNS